MNAGESFLSAAGNQAGVCLHISSLPGVHGIGDIAGSSQSFLDTLVEMGLGVWQFLPTGPTAYGDSPYQPLSAFAGNTLLIGLEPLVNLGLLDAADVSSLRDLPRDTVDFGRLIPAKRALLKKAARRFCQQPAGPLRVEYEEFRHRHGPAWLDDYALYRVLKTLHHEKPWPEWDRCFVHRETAALRKISDEHLESLDQTRFSQFLFLQQWQELKSAASSRGIGLFGDMPIYIALDSADAWAHPEILLIDHDGKPSRVAGVPPDYFSEDGQLWGNPIYDWAYHESSGYRWWIERMEHATRLSDLVRVDHFRGFESFWSVTFGSKTARDGEWAPGPGNGLFKALHETLGSLPIVAEDLGVITPQVDKLRLDHGMPGMVVLQFEAGDPEFDIGAIEQNSVCYTGTHDNDTTVGWFLGTGEDTRTRQDVLAMQKRVLELTGGTQASVHQDMIRLAFSSKSALAIAPMQDYLGLGSGARMNIPGTTMNNWRWRLQVEQLNPERVDSVRKLVQEGSRLRGKALHSAA